MKKLNLDYGTYVLLLNPVEKPTLAYYYFNEDDNIAGFGFNIADGGGFLPASDLTSDTKVVPVEIRADIKPEELLFSFVSWLTTRKEKLTLSSEPDTAVAADMVKQFCDVNIFKWDVDSDAIIAHTVHPRE